MTEVEPHNNSFRVQYYDCMDSYLADISNVS